MTKIIPKKKGLNLGQTPAVALCNPKYPHNVGGALRAASCFGIPQLFYSGNRITAALGNRKRLPREERMKGYSDVDLIECDYFFDLYDRKITPVAVEVRENSELLTTFEHPEDALYVFGPEDGSIPKAILHHCHRFVIIPTRHCTNLAAAVYITLYDRQVKRQLNGLEPILSASEILAEDRGYKELEHL